MYHKIEKDLTKDFLNAMRDWDKPTVDHYMNSIDRNLLEMENRVLKLNPNHQNKWLDRMNSKFEKNQIRRTECEGILKKGLKEYELVKSRGIFRQTDLRWGDGLWFECRIGKQIEVVFFETMENTYLSWIEGSTHTITDEVLLRVIHNRPLQISKIYDSLIQDISDSSEELW